MEKTAYNQVEVTGWETLDELTKLNVKVAKIGERDVKNDVTDINPITNFKNLLECWISGALIKSLDFVYQCSNLKILRLYYCLNVDSINFIQNQQNLEDITLYGLKITKLEIIHINNQLKSLGCGECDKLTEITGLQNCQQLKKLYLQNTQISDISSIVDLNTLEYLDTENTSLPQQFQVELKNQTQIAELLQQWKQTDLYKTQIQHKLNANNAQIQIQEQKQINDDKLEKLTTNFQELATEVNKNYKVTYDRIQVNHTQTKDALNALTQQMNQNKADLNNNIDQRYNEVNNKINDIQSEIQTQINTKFDHIEEKLNATQQQISGLTTIMKQFMNMIARCNDD